MHISNQLIKDQEYFHWFNKGKIVNTNLEKDEDSATNFEYEDHGHSFWPDDSPRTPTNNKKNGSGILYNSFDEYWIDEQRKLKQLKNKFLF